MYSNCKLRIYFAYMYEFEFFDYRSCNGTYLEQDYMNVHCMESSITYTHLLLIQNLYHYQFHLKYYFSNDDWCWK